MNMTPFLIGTAWTSVPPCISSASVFAMSAHASHLPCMSSHSPAVIMPWPEHDATPAIAAPSACVHSFEADAVFALLPMQQPPSPSSFAPFVDAVTNVAPEVLAPPWAGHPAAAALACIGQPPAAPEALAAEAFVAVFVLLSLSQARAYTAQVAAAPMASVASTSRKFLTA